MASRVRACGPGTVAVAAENGRSPSRPITQLSTPSKSPVWTSSLTCLVPVAVMRFGPVYVGWPLAKS